MQFLSFRKQSAPSNRLTYAALLMLALGAGAALPDAALADAGKRGGGQGGQAMKNGTTNPLIRGGEGGGLEAIVPGDAVGAGGNASGSPNTGGLGPLVKAGNGERHTVNANMWGFNGLCTQPCNPDNPDRSGGGGGAAVSGGEDVSFTLSVGKSLTGGQGGAGSAGLVYPDKTMVQAGGGGGGGAGIAVKSGTLTLNGAVTGGAGGSAPGHPGDGGDAVVLGRGNIIVNGKITGGQGGARLYDGKPATQSGNGGTGISIGSGTVINNDVVLGGAAGAVDSVALKGNVGAALRAGSNTTVTNKGRFEGSGGTAIQYEGNDNALILWENSSILGGILFSGERNQLSLGSDSGSPITMRTEGFVNFGTDGVFHVRITPTAADRLNVVGGAARLNGAKVLVNALDSGMLYEESTTYKILHADLTLKNTRFGDVASNLAYLTPTLSYSDDDQDALLTLVRKEAPAPRPPDPAPPVIDPVPPPPDPAPPVIDPAPPSPDPAPPVIDPAPPSPDPAPPVIDPAPPSPDPAPPVIDPVPPSPDPVPPVIDPVPPSPDPVPPVIDPAPPSPDPVPPVIDPAPPSPDPVPPEAGGGAPSGSIRFADLLGGRNAIAAANAIDGLPDGHDLYRHALNLPEGAPQAFFSALAGELHASVRHALPGLDATIRNVPLAHLRANLSAGLRPGEPIAAVGLSDAAPAASTLPVSRARPVWAQLIGNWQRQDATDDTTAVRLRTTGLFVGADHALGAGWRLGGALGYTDSQLRTKGTADRGGIDSYSALAYGGKAFEAGPGTLNLMLGASHTWHDIDTRRRVAVGGLDQTLRAGYRANTTQVFTELGYTLAPGSGLTLEPYAGLAWAGLRSRAFQESGGSAALSGTRQATRTTTATLGLRAAQSLQMGPLQGSVTAGAGWRRAFGDLRPTSTLAFDTGSAFTVTGAPIARNAALLEAGLQAQAGRNATVALNYAGQIGAGSRDHSATLSWRWTF
ncbi:autotransporter outer membrane beta-barrel domain-containing protein [Achromobacter xylosoxidans]